MSGSSRVVVRYPYPEPPPEGTSMEVAPGIHWVRMPLPFALDHINVYLLEDRDGWTIVDCGLNKDQVKGIWRQVFDRLVGGAPIRRVIVTHFHPDHMGLCRWLAEDYGAEVWMSQAEWLWSHFAFESRERNIETMLDFWRRNGMSVETIDGMRGRGNFYAQNVLRPPVVYKRLFEGDSFEIGGRVWRVIVGRGHSPEHVCLACEEDGLLISGDQVLPRITTNISVQYTEPDADPLRLFLESTHRFAGLRADTLTLCSHDRPFYNLHERLAQLRDHHDVRLDDAAEFCSEPRSAVDMMPILFRRKLTLHQESFAIGEAIAHAHRLMYDGRVERLKGEDGVYRFIRAV